MSCPTVQSSSDAMSNFDPENSGKKRSHFAMLGMKAEDNLALDALDQDIVLDINSID
ncbi:hypothetical protein RJ035_005961 [Blastomyces gilchristii]